MASGIDVLLSQDQQASGPQTGIDLLLSDQKPTAAKEAPPAAPVSRFDRFMKGLNDVSAAGAQVLANALPSGAVNAVNQATRYVNQLPVIGPVTQALGMIPATPGDLQKQASDTEAAYQAARGKDAGVDWLRLGGQTLGSAPLMAALPAASTLTGTAAQGALVGALTQPSTSEDFWTDKAKQAALSGAGGAASNLLLRGASAALAPKVSDAVKTLMDSGVTPTPGQIIGPTASRIEQSATSIPVLGDVIRNAQRRAAEDLNVAAFNRALAPVGETLPKGMTGREAVNYVGGKISDAYDSLLSKIGAVKPDGKFISDLADLQGMTSNLPKPQADQFGRILDSQILNRIDNNGVMTGDALKAAESNLGSLAKGYIRSSDFDQQQMGTAIRQAQSLLREMLARQKPDYAPQLSAVNSAYANFLRTEKAASYLGSDTGVFTAAQLQSAVRAMDPSKNKGSFAAGNALMQDLSDPAKAVLGATVPDSGTPLRHAVQAAVAGAAGHSMLPAPMAEAIIPAAGLLGAAALPYTQTGQKVAAALLTKRPDMMRQLGTGLLDLAPAAPVLGQALAQIAH